MGMVFISEIIRLVQGQRVDSPHPTGLLDFRKISKTIAGLRHLQFFSVFDYVTRSTLKGMAERFQCGEANGPCLSSF